jgi:ubiquinone/menaquinone biosynthesis C-methylase UbiE
MDWYTKYVLPPLIDLVMHSGDASRLRVAWVPQARGQVLEVGIGPGLNLPHYSAQVERVYGVDPSPWLLHMARKRARECKAPVELFQQTAETPLPLDDASMDTVVMTWTLCSIPDAARALRQMRRVLRRDGQLLFVEHGRAPDLEVVRWQQRLTPAWKKASGGCHMDRKVDSLITAAGFQITELHAGYRPGPRLLTYTYQGRARPL